MPSYGKRVPCGLGDRLGAAVAGLALSHTIGKAVWLGLATRGAPFLRTPKMGNAPALVQGLVMAREELALLVLTWAALVGVAIAHRLATWEATLWCVVLLTQSLPYLAAVFTSLVAAAPPPPRRPGDKCGAGVKRGRWPGGAQRCGGLSSRNYGRVPFFGFVPRLPLQFMLC